MYEYGVSLCVCVHTVKCVGVGVVSEGNFVESLLLSMFLWVPGLELMKSGLDNKCFYLLSHLGPERALCINSSEGQNWPDGVLSSRFCVSLSFSLVFFLRRVSLHNFGCPGTLYTRLTLNT